MKKFMKIIPMLLLCASLSSQTYLNIDVHEGKDTIEANVNNPNFTILDVRTANEYFPEHIEGAVYRDFYASDFELQLDSLSKTREYLIYCRSGNRSGQSLEIMKNLGFETVYNMMGGMTSWNNADYPVTDVIPPYVDIYATTTSVIDENFVQISAYPNPTLQSINVKLSDTQTSDVSYKIISLNGEEVLTGQISNSNSIDLSTLEGGVYNVIIIQDDVILNSTRVTKI